MKLSLDSRLATVLAAALVIPSALAHGTHHEASTSTSWGEIHMNQEHHIDNFDPSAFFHLHDFDQSGTWSADEILKTYGLERNDKVSDDNKIKVVKKIFSLMDDDANGHITHGEFVRFYASGHELPDFGYGPGHHGDDETEYELHHYEKYHNDDSPDSELNHPEDIAHFKKHQKEEEDRLKQEALERQPIIAQNIPNKYRKTL